MRSKPGHVAGEWIPPLRWDRCNHCGERFLTLRALLDHKAATHGLARPGASWWPPSSLGGLGAEPGRFRLGLPRQR